MKVIIAGSRNFNDYDLLYRVCDGELSSADEVVSGTARGADKLGERYAKEKGIAVKQFVPDWNKYGKAAGYKRNAEMANYADAAIIFWDGKSKGSKHMIDLARKCNLIIKIINF